MFTHKGLVKGLWEMASVKCSLNQKYMKSFCNKLNVLSLNKWSEPGNTLLLRRGGLCSRAVVLLIYVGTKVSGVLEEVFVLLDRDLEVAVSLWLSII